LKYFFNSFCVVFVVILPFLINDNLGALNGLLRLFQKPTWETRFDQIFFKGYTYNDSFLYTTQIKILSGFTISLWAIIQLSFYFLILVVLIQSLKNLRPIVFFKGCAFIYCALPLLTLGVGVRYYYWGIPVLLIIFFYDQDYFVLLYPVFLVLFSLFVITIINPIHVISQYIWFITLLSLYFYQILYIFANKKGILSDSFRF